MNQDDKMNQQVIDALRQTVASTYALIGQLHVCHWNVRGSSFFTLHDAFQAKYTELFTAVDEIAERIRAIGGLALEGSALLHGCPGSRRSPRMREPSRW